MKSESDSNQGKISVLHLITRFRYGGAERVTMDIMSALQKAERNYDITLGVGADSIPDRVESVRGSESKVVRFKSLKHYKPISLLFAVVAISFYLRRNEFDLIHTHSTEAGIVGPLAGMLAGTPVIIQDIHGDPISSDRNPFIKKALVACEILTASVTDALVAGSTRIMHKYLSRGVGTKDQYHVIYDGINLSMFESQEPAALMSNFGSGSQEKCRFLFVGRLVEGKGLFDLMDVFNSLPPSLIHGVELHVVGEGPLKKELEVQSNSLSDEEYVFFHGYREDIPSIMAAVDVLVLPSYREGTPRVITEARASGLPVIATDIAGIPEMIEDQRTGYLFQPGDTKSLADRIAELAKNPECRREMGDATRDGLKKFSDKKADEAYRELYTHLLADVKI